MSETILDRMNFYYLIVLLTEKINLRKEKKERKQNNLIYTVSNLIELVSSLENFA